MKKLSKGMGTLPIVVAIVAVSVLETIALLRGIDGVYFSLAILAIGALAGVKIADFLPKH